MITFKLNPYYSDSDVKHTFGPLNCTIKHSKNHKDPADDGAQRYQELGQRVIRLCDFHREGRPVNLDLDVLHRSRWRLLFVLGQRVLPCLEVALVTSIEVIDVGMSDKLAELEVVVDCL